MALAIALVALVVAITTFKSLNHMLRLFYAAITAVLLRGPLRCAYINSTENVANQVNFVSALKGKHKRVEYRARITRNQTLKTLETQVTLILHTTGKARLDYCLQQIAEFTYKSLRSGLLITDVVKGITTKCDCCLYDDREIGIINLCPIATLLSTTAEQVDFDATLTHS